MLITREEVAEQARFGRTHCDVQRATELLDGVYNSLHGNPAVEVGAMTDFEEALQILHDSTGNVELPLRDRNGRPFGIGVWFLYQVGTQNECKGILEQRDGVTWVRWDDSPDTCKLNDFWSKGTDPQLTEVIQKDNP